MISLSFLFIISELLIDYIFYKLLNNNNKEQIKRYYQLVFYLNFVTSLCEIYILISTNKTRIIIFLFTLNASLIAQY